MTQEELAEDAGLSVPTVRLLERTHGNLTSWHVVLRALGLEVAGRNLPARETLGRSIAALRRSRGFTQRGLVELVGVTQPTILALERYGRGRLEILDRVLGRLGAGAYLIARGEKKSFFTHAGNASTHQGWETPSEILEALYAVFGKFDLDPCSPRRSRPPVRARVHYTAEDDGLSFFPHIWSSFSPNFTSSASLSHCAHSKETGSSWPDVCRPCVKHSRRHPPVK
jgi:transcriptional regulator with XRE-family HTH domain